MYGWSFKCPRKWSDEGPSCRGTFGRGYRQEKLGDPMKMTTQGKEYATWVKVNGQWLYKTRQIASGSNPPEGWKE
jgi:hypothetical protein